MSDRFFVATRKGLFRYDHTKGNAKSPWAVTAVAFLGDPVSIVLPDSRDGTTYAAIGHGHFGVKLHRSSDGGDTWEECTAPAYPQPPNDAEKDRCPVRGIEIPWNLELIWALEPGGADEPGVLW